MVRKSPELLIRTVLAIAVASLLSSTDNKKIDADSSIKTPYVRYLPIVSNNSEITKKPEIVIPKEVKLTATILTYHEMSYLSFKRDMLDFINKDYEFLPIETFNLALDGKVNLGFKKKALVTCDDGRDSQYSVVTRVTEEIKNETGIFIPVVFFALTKFEEPSLPIEQIPDDTPSYNDGVHKYMPKWKLIDLLQRGFYVGNHTVNHADLTILPIDDRNAEVEIAQQRIEGLWRLAGKQMPVKILAYPLGRTNPEIIESLRALKFDLAFTTQPTDFHSSNNRLSLGRFGKS